MCSFINQNGIRITYDLVRQAMKGKPYPMSLVGKEALMVQQAVNIGIDSHLEACFVPDRGDSFKDKIDKVKGIVIRHALVCEVSPESLPVLLRRLFEQEYEPTSTYDDNPAVLAMDILETLGIGEDGKLKEDCDV